MSDKFNLLTEWITHNDGSVNPSLSIKEITKTNRTLYTTSKLEPNTRLFMIPSKLYLNPSNLKPLYEKEFKILGTHKAFHIFGIIKEKLKGAQSFWYPYLNMLPENYDDHILFYCLNNDFKYMEKINVYVYNRLKMLVQQVNNIVNSLMEFEKVYPNNITKQLIIWAYFVVSTREWNVKGLVPLADLFQHSNDSLMLLEDVKSNQETEELVPSQMTTKKEYKENEEIYDCYNILDDELLYTNYGFINKENKNRIVNVKEDFLTNLKLTDKSYDIFKIGFINIISQRNNSMVITNAGIANTLLYLTRIVNMTMADIRIVDMNKNFYEEPINIENEVNSYKYLEDMFNNLFYSLKHHIENTQITDVKFFKELMELNINKLNVYKLTLNNLREMKSKYINSKL